MTVHVGFFDPDNGDTSNDFSLGYDHTFTDAISGFLVFSSNDSDDAGTDDYVVAGLSMSF